jgi:predicted phage tail protein
VYLPLFALLNGAWVLRITAFTDVAWPASARVGGISGVAVTTLVAALMLVAVVVSLRPRTWHASDEIREEALRRDRESDRH